MIFVKYYLLHKEVHYNVFIIIAKENDNVFGDSTPTFECVQNDKKINKRMSDKNLICQK